MNIDDKLFNAITLLNELLEKPRFSHFIAVSDDSQEKALDKATEHLFLHNNTFGVDAKSTDIYKLLSWYGFYLSEFADDQKSVIYLATIYILNNKILYNELCKKKISHHLVSKIYRMLVLDGEDDNLAIGKNGLYISFRTARDICLNN